MGLKLSRLELANPSRKGMQDTLDLVITKLVNFISVAFPVSLVEWNIAPGLRIYVVASNFTLIDIFCYNSQMGEILAVYPDNSGSSSSICRFQMHKSFIR